MGKNGVGRMLKERRRLEVKVGGSGSGSGREVGLLIHMKIWENS